MGTKTNELLAHRLADMLYRLNQGETLDPKQLAEHYRTSVRTVYRDLTERFAYLPIQKVEHGYRLDTSYLGKLDFQDIKHFAALSGVVGMFPSFDRDFLRQLLDSRASLAYASKGQSFEDASLFKHLFELLKPAIVDRMHISFVYKDKRRHVEPYKLIHHRGCWYLAAVHQGILKAYRLSKVSDVQVRADLPVFTHDQAIVDQLKHEDSIWFGLHKQEVILSVDHSVASYFKARALLPDQQIIKHLNDGGLLVSSQMVNSLQILPLVRYWMPHLKIISPTSLHEELYQGLREYLN